MNEPISSVLALAPLALSQVPAVGATELGQWLLAGAAAAVIANQGMSFFKNLTSQFAKKQAAPGEAQISAADCEKKHREIEAKHLAIAAQMAQFTTEDQKRSENLRLELKEDVKGIHKRIDSILAGVSRLEGKTL